jgi:hypothetical protein
MAASSATGEIGRDLFGAEKLVIRKAQLLRSCYFACCRFAAFWTPSFIPLFSATCGVNSVLFFDLFLLPFGRPRGQVRELLDILASTSSFEGFATRPTAASYS